jgi:transcriptional regulator GlxA family with amidase domain
MEGKGRLDPPPGGPLHVLATRKPVRLGQHHQLPRGLVALHVPVGGSDVIQAEDALDVGPVRAGLDLADDPLQRRRSRAARLRAVAQLLYDQPADKTPLAELGRAIGASARTLSRLFHDELGLTFYQWRTQLRVYRALVLLADGHDTTHVAYACGWANPSGFIAAFTSIIGTTPGRYRTGRQNRASTQPMT